MIDCTPAFETVTLIACRMMHRGYVEDNYSSTATRGIACPLNDVEGVVHEICHFALAPATQRWRPNYGLSQYTPRREFQAEERMCGWVEDYLYARAGVTRPHSSVDNERYRDHPGERPEALRRWRKFVTRRLERAIVDALQMPGGDAGKYPEVY